MRCRGCGKLVTALRLLELPSILLIKRLGITELLGKGLLRMQLRLTGLGVALGKRDWLGRARSGLWRGWLDSGCLLLGSQRLHRVAAPVGLIGEARCLRVCREGVSRGYGQGMTHG